MEEMREGGTGLFLWAGTCFAVVFGIIVGLCF